eukprot:93909-Amphidinium_carterae.1
MPSPLRYLIFVSAVPLTGNATVRMSWAIGETEITLDCMACCFFQVSTVCRGYAGKFAMALEALQVP